MNVSTALLTGLLAGLFGSTHCLAMCGGIAGMLHTRLPSGRHWLAGGFHLGRITSYLAIALAATAIGLLPAALVPDAAPAVMRLALGLLVLTMALYIALPGRFRDIAGRLAAPLTRRILPLISHFMPPRTSADTIGLGLLWGLLPCGLLYTVVAAAILLADPLATTAMIIAFGLGTTPLLAGTGITALKFRSAINRRGLRTLAAALMALTGTLIAAGPWLAHGSGRPWLRFLVDCVSA